MPPKPTPTATSVIIPTATPVPPHVETFSPTDNTFNWLRDAFHDGDYDRVLEITDSALSQIFDEQPPLALAFRYYRALALEALERADEALAEYVAIYEAAPESAWGMLAGLHIERVNGEG